MGIIAFPWSQAHIGTMDAAVLYQPAFYGARADLYGQAVEIYWTRDGTATGTSLFLSTYMPMVQVMAAAPTNAQAWTNNAQWGPMLRTDQLSNMTPYAWVTLWDSSNSAYYTVVSQGSPPPGTTGAANGQRSGASVQVAKRPIFLFALGENPSLG